MGFLGYNNSFEKFFPNSDSGKAAPTYIILGSLMRIFEVVVESV